MTDKNKTFVSEPKNYSFGISQKAIIYDPIEDKYLLLKTRDGYFYKKYGPWDIAGGTLNPGETAKEALEREISEEVGGIDYEVLGLVAEDKILNSDGKEKIYLGYLVKWLGGEIEISDEHTEYKWESYKNIIEDAEHKDWLKNFIGKAQGYIESQKNLEGWKRCQADFENFKKRQAESQKDLIRYSTQNIVLQILPVIDNFQASTDHIPEDQKSNPWVTGIMYIQKQLEQVLTDNGVIEMETKIGDNFDPAMHEAVEDMECKGCKTKDYKFQNKIKKIVTRGYQMGDKVVRPARVIVE